MADKENPNERRRPDAVPYVDGSYNLNRLIDELNGLEREWNGNYEPIHKAKLVVLKQAGLEKVKGA